mgnify:CR=1 FL=1
MGESIICSSNGVALVLRKDGLYSIALIAGNYRHDYPKTYIYRKNAKAAWLRKVHEVNPYC